MQKNFLSHFYLAIYIILVYLALYIILVAFFANCFPQLVLNAC